MHLYKGLQRDIPVPMATPRILSRELREGRQRFRQVGRQGRLQPQAPPSCQGAAVFTVAVSALKTSCPFQFTCWNGLPLQACLQSTEGTCVMMMSSYDLVRDGCVSQKPGFQLLECAPWKCTCVGHPLLSTVSPVFKFLHQQT